MSICYTYQAIPYHPLIERALGDNLVLEHILHFPKVYEFLRRYSVDRALDEELDAITLAIVAKRPTIAERHEYLDCCAAFDPAAVEKAHVYKARREGDLDGMIEVIESLARLYREAANAGECVLVANDHA